MDIKCYLVDKRQLGDFNFGFFHWCYADLFFGVGHSVLFIGFDSDAVLIYLITLNELDVDTFKVNWISDLGPRSNYRIGG